MPLAKLIRVGGSQAVCLPQGFEFPGTEVAVSRTGDAVILETAEAAPGRKSLGEVMEQLRKSFPGACEIERPPQPPLPQSRQFE